MDPLAELEEISERGEKGGINFIPCIKWVQRGVAKSQPEKVRKTTNICPEKTAIVCFPAC